MKIDTQTLLIIILVILIIFLFFKNGCPFKRICSGREGLYLSANQGRINLGDPRHPSNQFLTLQAAGASEENVGGSLVLPMHN